MYIHKKTLNNLFIYFSLVPLLAKDGLVIPFIALTALFLVGAIRAYEELLLSFKTRQDTIISILVSTIVHLSLYFIFYLYLIHIFRNIFVPYLFTFYLINKNKVVYILFCHSISTVFSSFILVSHAIVFVNCLARN